VGSTLRHCRGCSRRCLCRGPILRRLGQSTLDHSQRCRRHLVFDRGCCDGGLRIRNLRSSDRGIFAAGTKGGAWVVRRSTDGGATWSNVDTFQLSKRYASAANGIGGSFARTQAAPELGPRSTTISTITAAIRPSPMPLRQTLQATCSSAVEVVCTGSSRSTEKSL